MQTEELSQQSIGKTVMRHITDLSSMTRVWFSLTLGVL